MSNDPEEPSNGDDVHAVGSTGPYTAGDERVRGDEAPTEQSPDDRLPTFGAGGRDQKSGLFDGLLRGDSIFEQKEVLRLSYTPDRLPHRHGQIDDIATILVSALRGETPSNILVYGKTGTGKTASARYVSDELERTAEEYTVLCDVEYINCEVTDTRYRVLARLANAFIEDNLARLDDDLERYKRLIATEDRDGLATTGFDSIEEAQTRVAELERYRDCREPVPMTGWPTDRVYDEFFAAVDLYRRVVVIMLDEIDKLVEKSGDDTLYNLARVNSRLDRSRVSIIGISNDLRFTEFLDPRVRSSLGEEEVVFPPYDARQLSDILSQRSERAFSDGVLADEVIPLCSAFAAREHGDARRAIDLLRTAGEIAERSNDEMVVERHVRRAQEKIEFDRIVEAVRTLPQQSRIVLRAIVTLEARGERDVNTGDVFNEYERTCTGLDVNPLTQRRVTDLIDELDMLGIVNAVVVSQGRYGRTKEINLSVPVEDIRSVLDGDSRFGEFDERRS